jgi:hypothetical protein
MSLKKLLALSDIISIHCPLNPKKQTSFDSIAFSKIKKRNDAYQYKPRSNHQYKDAIEALKRHKLDIWVLMCMKVKTLSSLRIYQIQL